MKIQKFKVAGDSTDYPIRTRIVRIVEDEPNEPYELPVCDVLPSTKKKQHINLIAASPDLLEALQTCLNWAKNGNQEDLIVFEAAQTAINKATGNNQ